MGFQTVIRYSTDAGLQGASSVHEDGKPNEICLQGLLCNTQYYVMADLVEDGVRVAQSEKADFTTLACGSMTLTYDYYRRTSCAAHTVVYNYTSTYAASSCILHVAGPNGFTANYQGVIDSNAGTVTFTASDWEGGEGYTFNATLYDLYGEELTSATTSITSGTIDEIELSVTAVTETTVTLAITKCNDCGFYAGWVDVWLGTEDPDTDPSDFHETITSSDTGITITGLTSDTAYYFRATFVCDDRTTEVTGAAVTATTKAHEYRYFYLQNTTNGSNTFTLNTTGTPATSDLSYSIDGSNWVAFGLNTATETVIVPQGGKIYLRSSTGLSTNGNNYVKFSMIRQHTAGGHIASLLDYTNMDSCSSIPDKSFMNLFYGDTYLTDTSAMDWHGVTAIGKFSCHSMFYNCTSLTAAPDLSDVASIDSDGCEYMFYGCSSLTAAPDLSDVARIGEWSCRDMFNGCASMTSATGFGKLTSVSAHGCTGMFRGCSLLTSTLDLSGVTSIGDNGCTGMFAYCTSLTAAPDLSKVTTVGGYGCSQMFMYCTSLTTAADLRRVTTVGGNCAQMYAHCESLTSVYAPRISSWNTDNFWNWLDSVAVSGVVYKPSSLTIPSNSASGVPSGWTTQNY